MRGAVDLSSREMSPETFTQFEDALFKRVFTQVHSTEIHEKLGAVAAMHSLIDVSSGEAETKIIKFANTLSDLIRTNTDPALLEAVARALGHLAHASVVPNTDYVEFEVSRRLPLRCEGERLRMPAHRHHERPGQHPDQPPMQRAAEPFLWNSRCGLGDAPGLAERR